MASGIATVSKELVLGTVHKYDWFQVGAAINHPEAGKVLDVSEDIQKNYGIADANVKILPWNGYGNADLIRQLINTEKPDAILHFTDPRYWTWLYDIEHEIRQNVPLYFTQFGMIYQTHYIIVTSMKVVIGLVVFLDKHMVSLKDYQR
jgi:hypothetical protein